MGQKVIDRHLTMIAVALVCAVGTAGAVGAQPAKVIDAYDATMTGVTPANGDAVTFDILRWSTDEEAQKLVAVFKEKGDKQWADALQSARSIGYIWTADASLGYSIKYARHFGTANDGERIVVAIDRPLGSWSRPPWKATSPAAVDYPFSVIELSLDRKGTGEGKASLAAKVIVDETIQSVALENDASAPVLLKGVKRIDTSAEHRSGRLPHAAYRPIGPHARRTTTRDGI